ncbi:MAG: Gfo/Idh/MocA family oxidoreductase [Acidobacteria bacterium]|nr:Gfo/Idh/MocA family oxidoreductase [Acidobacteriota bacterium]
MNNNIERRNFIKQSLATGMMAAASRSRVLGANDRIRVGAIGIGRQGRGLTSGFKKNQDVEIVALCDVYEPQIAQTISEARLEGVQTYKDFRQVLERKDVDAVIIATPDHWHALNTVMACQAGKDVYVEKPLSVTVAEGRKMVEAARRHSRIVQVGTQQRSGDHYQKAAEVIRAGQIGKVTYVRSWNFGNIAPDGLGNPPDGNPPPGLDWDMWLGPANKVPFNANRFGVHPDRYSSFRYFWDYAGGMMTDWGVHHIDIIQMIMGVDTPQAITAMGGKYVLRDNRDTPDTLSVTYEYPGFISTYENRECNGQSLNGRGYGISFHGTEATLFINREAYEIVPERERRGIASSRVENANRQGETHIRNFLDCIKSRQLPTSDIEIGHRSTSTSLLGNVALRSNRRIAWNGKLEKIEGDQTGAKFLTREYRKPWKL